MKKLPGQGGLTKKIATSIGNRNRKKFAKQVDLDLSNLVEQVKGKEAIAMEVASFSSCNDFSEQVLSILSFVRYVGIPIKWTLYSDGSHTRRQIEQLENGFDFVLVRSIDFTGSSSIENLCKEVIKPYHQYVLDYANTHAFGKRLFYYLNHPIDNPTLFIDSDILFYKKAAVFNLLISEKPRSPGWFMPDVGWGCLDSRYKAVNSEQVYQVNAGFMFLLEEFKNLSEGLDFYKALNNKYEYFSEQTIIHTILKANSYMPLTPKTFILDTADQFDFKYLKTPTEIAVRHYTGPVRHKMWQKNYRWHLNI
jgi:hypothetical protein